MFAPANPPRVGSNVAAVTRVCVLAARGMFPPASAIPFNVVRFDSAPEPRIDGPSPVIVTLDIVPAIAFGSPCDDGGMAPLTPSIHFSAGPGSRTIGPTSFLGRTALLRVDF